MGTYCNETDIEGITQFDISASTSPNSTEVATWITQVEADVDARALGSYTLTDQLIDVYPRSTQVSKNTVAWLEAIAGGKYDGVEGSNRIVPPFLPIVSVASLSRRTSALGSDDAWEELTECSSSGNSFIILKRRSKTNQYLGYCLYFFQNKPYCGLQRIKITYNYGWNLSTSIIGEWCGLKVSLKVLDAIINDTTPIGSGDYSVLDINIGIDPVRRRVDVLARIKEIEDEYFPGKKLGMALV